MLRPRLGPSAPALMITTVAAIVLVWQLMTPPVVGMANNGDWGKITARFGMGSDTGFEFASTKHVFRDRYRYDSGFQSSELLLLVPALAVNRLISRDGSFDIRVIGAIHEALFLLAIFLFFQSIRSWWLGPIALLLFCDFMYTGYFNSFYMDTAAYLFTLLAVVFYVRAMHRPAAVETAGLLIAMLLAITSKPQYAILGPWFALLFWMGRGILCGGSKRTASASAALLLLTTGISFRFLAPDTYRAKAAFNVIFGQVAQHARNPVQALEELGLDASYSRWIGGQAYIVGPLLEDPAFYRPFLERTSLAKAAIFYGRHPADAWTALRSAMDETGRFEPPGGNFDPNAGKPPGAQYSSFHLARDCKRRLFEHHGVRLLTCVVGVALLMVGVLLGNRKRLPEGALGGGIVLASMTVSTFVICGLADVYEQARHQLVSFALFDMLLLAMTWLIVEFRRRRVPGLAIVLIGACGVAVGCILYRPLLPGEFDDYIRRIRNFAIWNTAVVILVTIVAAPGRTWRAAGRFLAAAVVCVCFAGWLIYRIAPAASGQYDDFDHRVQFMGEWSRDRQFPNTLNHSLSYTDTPNAVFRLAFHGSEISWVYTMAGNRGIAAVSIDGQPCGEVDLYSPETQWQRRSVFPVSGRGDHVFEVRMTGRKNLQSSGTYIDVDTLIVR